MSAKDVLQVSRSTNISINVQIITGVIGIAGMFYTLEPKHQILKSVLILELGVQAVELIFYIFILRKIVTTRLSEMASIRYFDWVFTTPVMLLTTIVYFTYEKRLADGNTEPLHLGDFVKENIKNIAIITLCNLLMLIFGYLGETGRGNKWLMGGLGFAGFFGAFYVIYTEYASKTNVGKNLFGFLFVIWALYGVAYGFGDVTKNHMYNSLDILAKNFFGIFLALRIYNART